MFHNAYTYVILYDSFANPSFALINFNLCWCIVSVLFNMPVFLKRRNEHWKNYICRFSICMPYHYYFLGPNFGMEVLIYIYIRLIRLTFFPNDYEKVMKNVKRTLIERKILKSSMESVGE